jgi:hypothetical protein
MCGHYTWKPLDRELVDAEWTRCDASSGPPFSGELRGYAIAVTRLDGLEPLRALRFRAVSSVYGSPSAGGADRAVRF